MTNWRKQRWICYVLVLIMAVTGTSVCAFAAPNEDVENDAPEVVANELEAFDETEGVDETEAVENIEEEAAEIAVIEVSGVVDEETNNCTISWPAVEGADKYVIEYGDVVQELSGEELSFIIEDYAGEIVTVKAFMGDELIAEGLYPDEAVLSADATFAAPAISQEKMNIRDDINQETAKGDKWTTSKGKLYEVVVDKPITVTWAEVPGAESYDIQRLSMDSYGKQSEVLYNGEWYTIVQDLPKETLKYVDNLRTAEYLQDEENMQKNTDLLAGTYTYKIVAKDAAGNVLGESLESEEAVVPNFIFTGDYKNLIWHIKAKKTTKLYKSRSGNSSYVTVPKGTKGTIVTRRPYRSKVKITVKGKNYTGWMIRKQIGPYRYRTEDYGGNINTRSAEITDRDYTKAAKEKYAKKFYSKGTKYFVWISRYTQKINIFQKKNGKYELIRVCECSTGAYLNYTGTMTKRIYKHLKTRNRSNYKYQYLSYFWKENSMHGPCYLTKNAKGHLKGQMKKSPSDKTSTLGCVRTWPADAEFIYKLPNKTKVRVFY